MNHLRYIPRSARRVPIESSHMMLWNGVAICLIVVVYLLVAIGMVIYSATAARSQDNHELHHAQYQNWNSNAGYSCCDNKDCGTLDPSRVRDKGNHIEVLIIDARGDQWCPVEFKHLVNQDKGKRPSPDWTLDHARIIDQNFSALTCERLKCFMEKGRF